MNTDKNDSIEVFFNDSCSVCRMEINHYKKQSSSIKWTDITNNESAQLKTNKDSKSLLRRLHTIHDQKLYQGIDAFLIVWKTLPNYKWLYYIVRTPVIYHLGYVFYEIIASILYFKNRHQDKS